MHHSMQELPPGLQDLDGVVKVIDVSSNMLDSLPAVLSAMHKLERLIASGNRIAMIQCQMSNWTKLKVSLQMGYMHTCMHTW